MAKVIERPWQVREILPKAIRPRRRSVFLIVIAGDRHQAQSVLGRLAQDVLPLLVAVAAVDQIPQVHDELQVRVAHLGENPVRDPAPSCVSPTKPKLDSFSAAGDENAGVSPIVGEMMLHAHTMPAKRTAHKTMARPRRSENFIGLCRVRRRLKPSLDGASPVPANGRLFTSFAKLAQDGFAAR